MLYFETPRLILRDHIPEDLDSHCAIMMDPVTMDYVYDVFCPTRKDAEDNYAFCAQQAALPLEERRFFFLRMVRKEDGAHIGETGFDWMPEEELPRAHLGYFSKPEYWGNGYMTEAAKELVRFAFETLGARVVTSGCLNENIGSYRVMEHCGMTRSDDGTLLESYHGDMRPRREYKITKEQWLAGKENKNI